MKSKIYIIVLVFGFFITQNVFAFEKKAENFITQTTNNARSIILDNKLSKIDKKKKLEKLALDAVDTEGLARYTLGEKRKKLSNKELKNFIDIFKIFFSKNISNKLTDYSDQEVKVLSSKKISEIYVLVRSKIISKIDKQEIKVDWRVFLINDKLVIRDLVVEGLSLARTQREEFASIIANKGLGGLIKSLNEYIIKN